MAKGEELGLLQVRVMPRQLDQDAQPLRDLELAGHPQVEPDCRVLLIAAAAAPIQAVAAQADVESRLVVALRETVLAGDGDVGKLGFGQRAEALLAVERGWPGGSPWVALGTRSGDRKPVFPRSSPGLHRRASDAPSSRRERIELLARAAPGIRSIAQGKRAAAGNG